jgi:hypothetical protein
MMLRNKKPFRKTQSEVRQDHWSRVQLTAHVEYRGKAIKMGNMVLREKFPVLPSVPPSGP